MLISEVTSAGVLLSDHPELIRPVASALIQGYVPSTTGDPRFKEITVDYGGAGTTCGYLLHWLMFRLGIRMKGLVNRTDHDSDLRYTPGANISMIRNNKYFHLYNPNDPYEEPDLCDLVFISEGPSDTEHVCVFGSLVKNDAGVDCWMTADAGQTDKDTGKQCSRILTSPFTSSGCLTHASWTRHVVGWIPLDVLPFTAPATLDIAA